MKLLGNKDRDLVSVNVAKSRYPFHTLLTTPLTVHVNTLALELTGLVGSGVSRMGASCPCSLVHPLTLKVTVWGTVVRFVFFSIRR